MNATPIRSEDGKIETLVVTLQNMPPFEDLERLRAEFLTMVSDELRTPDATIRGSVSTLLDPPAALNPAERTQMHRIIDAQMGWMHVPIGDLLDVDRIETGTRAVSPEPTDAAVVVGESRNGFRSGRGRHDGEIYLAPDLPWVMADRLRIVQVQSNLLINAARHSPEPSPVRVSAEREGVHVAVSVSARGRGIPAESLPDPLRKFSRIESQEQWDDTGLGLAICKGIVGEHGAASGPRAKDR